jgi:ATP-dependent helicase/nuclease subunit B
VIVCHSRTRYHAALRELAAEGVPWLGVSVATPVELACRETEAMWGRSDHADAPAILSLVADLLHEVEPARAYFGDLVHSVGTARAVARTLQDLRLAELSPGTLDPSRFLDPARGRALRGLFAAYEGALSAHDLLDDADVLRWAIRRRAEGWRPPPQRYLLPRSLAATPLERAYLASLCGDGGPVVLDEDEPEGVDVPFDAVPFLRALPHVSDPKAVFAGLGAGLLGDRFPAVDVQVFAADGLGAEVLHAARSLLNGQVPLDRTEILLPAADPYAPAVCAVLDRLEIPYTTAFGAPAAATRPGRAALMLLNWLEAGAPARLLADAFSDGLLRATTPDGEPLGSRAVARRLRTLPIGWGRDRYLPVIDRELSRLALETDAGAARERAQLEGVRAAVAFMLDALPDAGAAGLVVPVALCRGLVRILETFGVRAGPQDVAGWEALRGALTQVAQGGGAAWPQAATVAHVRTVVRDLRVGISGPRPGHLHVGSLLEGAHGREVTWLLGMDQSVTAGAVAEDPVLLDEERRALSLPTSTDLRAARTYRLATSLAALRGDVRMSYSLCEPGQDRDSFPSRLLLDVHRLARRAPEADYAALGRSVGGVRRTPSAELPVLAREEAWVAQALIGVDERFRRALGAEYPRLERSREAQLLEEADAPSEWDGLLDVERVDVDPRVNGQVMSARRLEALAACPRRYLYEYVLGIRRLDEFERDVTRWLDPRTRGNVLHEIYRDFYASLGGPVTGVPAEETLLSEVVDRVLEKTHQDVPSPSDVASERDEMDIRRSAQVFLALDRREAGRSVPVFFEFAFGYEVEDGKSPVVVTVADGSSIRVRGRIDRIDRLPDGRYEIWDYKTGKPWEDRGGLMKGRRLQHALYAAVVETILGEPGRPAEVARSGYRFPTAAGAGATWMPDPDARQRLPGLLRSLLDVAAGGAFVPAPDAEHCRFCDFRSACPGPRAAAVAERKLAAGLDGARLDPLREVMSYA